MRHIKHFKIGLDKIVILLLLIIMAIGTGAEKDYAIVEEKLRSTIAYPQIKSSAIDTKNVNKAIIDNLFGPYTFLEDERVAVDMDYQITHHDKAIISICYSGVYAYNKESVGNFSFGLTVDIKSGDILAISNLFSRDEILKLKEQMYMQNFKVVYGAIGEGEGKISIEDALINQRDLFSENNRYQFCLGDKAVNIIISNLPTYLGNYSILQIPLESINSIAPY